MNFADRLVNAWVALEKGFFGLMQLSVRRGIYHVNKLINIVKVRYINNHFT